MGTCVYLVGSRQWRGPRVECHCVELLMNSNMLDWSLLFVDCNCQYLLWEFDSYALVLYYWRIDTQ